MSRWALSALRLALAAGFVLTAVPSNAQNLVPDPHFSSGTSAWIVPAGITFVRVPGPGADGAPGFATLMNNGFANAFASTCIPVQPGIVVYSFGGKIRFQSSTPEGAFFVLNFFPDAGCGPFSTFLPVSTPVAGDTPGAWTPWLGFATAPPGAASALLVFFRQNSLSTSSAAVDVDDVFFGRAGTVEPTIAIPSLSLVGVLALGVALALCGVLAVRSAGR